jgi:formimidoylglutamase
MRVPHTRPGVWPETIPSGRFAAAIERDRAEPNPSGRPTLVMLGLPDDAGVALNGGRVGAAEGPSAFRAALAGYGTPFDLERGAVTGVRVLDAGDVVPAEGRDEAALHDTHRRVTDAVRVVHEAGFVPVCVGGGHDLTYASVRALAEHVVDGSRARAPGPRSPDRPLGGLNVDAHLDVREAVGSGMPFRWLIDGGYLDARRFAVLGASRFAHASEHARWLGEGGAAVFGVGAVRDDTGTVDHAFSVAFGSVLARSMAPGFVTIDLDAIDGAYAPGVSAVNPSGLDVPTLADIAERAGRTPGVRHFDLMELSPPHDVDGRTARVAALLFLHFVAGFMERAS